MFDFITDDRLRRILERDWADLCACAEAGAHKSVLVMAGSIVEATLVDYFVGNPPANQTSDAVLRMTLAALLNEAVPAGLMTAETRNLCDAIKDFRNLIHPGREVRVQGVVDAKRAGVARHVVEIVVDEVATSIAKQGRVTAEKLIDMVSADPTKASIAEFLLGKMTSIERERLLRLVPRAIAEHEGASKGVGQALVEVHALTKKRVPATLLESEVRALPELLKGDTLRFLLHLKLYADDLQLLLDDDRSAILVFVASTIKSGQAAINQVERTCDFDFVGRYINAGNVSRLADVLASLRFLDRNVEVPVIARMVIYLSPDMGEKLRELLAEASASKSVLNALDAAPF